MHMKRILKNTAGILLGSIAVVVGAIAQHSLPDTVGATRIVITYRCNPRDRPVLLQEMRKNGERRFAQWKREGAIQDYLLLFNSFVDTTTWDMLSVISFSDYQQTDRWRDIEEVYPGGLDSALLRIVTPSATFLSEQKWQAGKNGDPTSALYMVIPYEHPDRGVYIDFVNSVLVPQFAGWMKEGAVRSWSILLNKHYPGKPWDILLLLEYDGVRGLSQRDAARAATEASLKTDAGWKLLREISSQFRNEYDVSTARVITPKQ